MAKKAMILKQQAEPKFSSRRYNRCKICGRPHAYLRNYGICRICFRELAYKGEIPGVRKASWSFYGNLLKGGSFTTPAYGPVIWRRQKVPDYETPAREKVDNRSEEDA